MSGIVSQNALDNSGLIKAAEAGGGAWTLIKSITASADANIAFVNGASDVVLDSTYPIYKIGMINCHPGHSSRVDFQFNFSADTGSNYNVGTVILASQTLVMC